jgi:hypothetical protein
MGSLGSFCVIGLGWAACVLLQAAFQGTQPWLTAPAGAVLLAADVVWVLRRHRSQANADWDVVRRQCGFSRKAVRAARRAALDPEAVMLHALSSPPEWRAVIQEQLLDCPQPPQVGPWSPAGSGPGRRDRASGGGRRRHRRRLAH